ncbi:MAG: glycosyltransferase family 4 protein [Gemmatimonadetes bacterium]|nr:glycosyltransferase family 4 protein [Gemmatimonadota bacterium]
MKIYVSHPYHDHEKVMASNGGAVLSGFNHVQALSKYCEVYMPASEAVDYGPNLHGIQPAFETIDASRQWFERQDFDGVLMFEPRADDLAFFRHVCPAPIVIRLSCSFGHNRDFVDKVLQCYSLLRPYDALSPKSAYVADEVGKLVFDRSYLRPITNGVDAEVFKPMDKLQVRKEVADKTGDQRFLEMPVVGFSGRFEPGKGAYPFLRMADLNPNVLFAVIGKQFAPVTHPPNVIFLGAQPYTDMPLYYNMLDVLCSLSVYSYESCPSTVLEGMACGLPVVATHFAGAPELLGSCGRLIEIERFEDEPLNVTGYIAPEMISDVVRDLLNSKRERIEMGEGARKRALEFSWDHTAQQHMALFEDLRTRRDAPACPIPITVSFTQGCDVSGVPKSVSKGFNYLGSVQGPLPRISFLGQDMSLIEGLGLYLMQHLHPNEVEAALMGLCETRDRAYKTLRKIRHFSDMLTAP